MTAVFCRFYTVYGPLYSTWDVCKVSLYDERPFEHEFFIRIEKSFPMMKKLILNNDKPQKKKFFAQSNQHFSIIKYSHLTELELFQAHYEYLKNFYLIQKHV
jgi:hypothetical protein